MKLLRNELSTKTMALRSAPLRMSSSCPCLCANLMPRAFLHEKIVRSVTEQNAHYHKMARRALSPRRDQSPRRREPGLRRRGSPSRRLDASRSAMAPLLGRSVLDIDPLGMAATKCSLLDFDPQPNVQSTRYPWKDFESDAERSDLINELVGTSCAGPDPLSGLATSNACCPACPNPCGCCPCSSCLPPPCCTPPKCVQYMRGYYYYPYGTWFCGPYHVAGLCQAGGPCSPGCPPCGPPCNPCCAPCCNPCCSPCCSPPCCSCLGVEDANFKNLEASEDATSDVASIQACGPCGPCCPCPCPCPSPCGPCPCPPNTPCGPMGPTGPVGPCLPLPPCPCGPPPCNPPCPCPPCPPCGSPPCCPCYVPVTPSSPCVPSWGTPTQTNCSGEPQPKAEPTCLTGRMPSNHVYRTVTPYSLGSTDPITVLEGLTNSRLKAGSCDCPACVSRSSLHDIEPARLSGSGRSLAYTFGPKALAETKCTVSEGDAEGQFNKFLAWRHNETTDAKCLYTKHISETPYLKLTSAIDDLTARLEKPISTPSIKDDWKNLIPPPTSFKDKFFNYIGKRVNS